MSDAVEAGVPVQAGALKTPVDFLCAASVLGAGFRCRKAATSPDSPELLRASPLERKMLEVQ